MLDQCATVATPHRNTPGALVVALLAFAVAITGCNREDGRAALADPDECSLRVIVHHAAEPDSEVLADLERSNALALEPVGVITRVIRVYTLRAAGTDDACIAALYRLRHDVRVSSVDLDVRRGLHGNP